MTAKANRIGQRFKHCVVVAEAGRDKKSNVLWRCLCDCGTEFTARGYDLTSGRIISCKCAPKAPIKHGKASHRKVRSKIYSVWAALVNRCTNPNDRNYANYGGRGIGLAAEWREFEKFYSVIGDPPFVGATLDRIDNDKGYVPGNVRWVTHREQMRNTRNNRWITYGGKTQILADWVKELGCDNASIFYRVNKGMTFEEAVADVYERGTRKRKSS